MKTVTFKQVFFKCIKFQIFCLAVIAFTSIRDTSCTMNLFLREAKRLTGLLVSLN